MKLTKYLNAVIRVTQKKDKYWNLYLIFAVIRILLVLIPQCGYIHPDEFFQSTEILLGTYMFIKTAFVFSEKKYFSIVFKKKKF